MPSWLLRVGRIFYAIGLIGIGIQHFIYSDCIPVILPSWPAWIPGRPFFAYAIGALLIGSGIALLVEWKTRAVAAITGLCFLLLVVFAHIPTQLAGSPAHLAVWSNAFKALSFCGGAWVIAEASRQRSPGDFKFLDPAIRFGRYFLPITCVVFGYLHFLYPAFAAGLVPSWIPGHFFWAYFCGIALIAGGLGVIANVQARLASLLLGAMIFIWFLVLHIPRAIVEPPGTKGNELTSAFEALAFSGIALMTAVLLAEKRAPFAREAQIAALGRSS